MSLTDNIRNSKFLRTAIAVASLSYLVSCGSSSGSSDNGDGGNGCIEDWVCNDWGSCQRDGNQYRVCRDLNECGTTYDKPEIERECTVDPCANGECDITVYHNGLEDLAFNNEDRDRNGILDIDDFANKRLGEGYAGIYPTYVPPHLNYDFLFNSISAINRRFFINPKTIWVFRKNLLSFTQLRSGIKDLLNIILKGTTNRKPYIKRENKN